jgi:hypothetical protein
MRSLDYYLQLTLADRLLPTHPDRNAQFEYLYAKVLLFCHNDLEASPVGVVARAANVVCTS